MLWMTGSPTLLLLLLRTLSSMSESEADPILDALLDCANVTGDQALLCRLWENVARSIRAS
jgi:hypothetical protein